MITISIKIKKEDKKIMLKQIKGILDEMRPAYIHEAFTMEELQRIYTKLLVSQNSDRAVSLNLAQMKVFEHYLIVFYEHLGACELANSISLIDEICKKVMPKIKSLTVNH